jgi:hypothetical protein
MIDKLIAQAGVSPCTHFTMVRTTEFMGSEWYWKSYDSPINHVLRSALPAATQAHLKIQVVEPMPDLRLVALTVSPSPKATPEPFMQS